MPSTGSSPPPRPGGAQALTTGALHRRADLPRRRWAPASPGSSPPTGPTPPASSRIFGPLADHGNGRLLVEDRLHRPLLPALRQPVAALVLHPQHRHALRRQHRRPVHQAGRHRPRQPPASSPRFITRGYFSYVALNYADTTALDHQHHQRPAQQRPLPASSPSSPTAPKSPPSARAPTSSGATRPSRDQPPPAAYHPATIAEWRRRREASTEPLPPSAGEQPGTGSTPLTASPGTASTRRMASRERPPPRRQPARERAPPRWRPARERAPPGRRPARDRAPPRQSGTAHPATVRRRKWRPPSGSSATSTGSPPAGSHPGGQPAGHGAARERAAPPRQRASPATDSASRRTRPAYLHR